eukprot:8859088-Prorocentrum_lima.AAC.1
MILRRLLVERACLSILGLTRVMLDAVKRPGSFIATNTPRTIGHAVGRPAVVVETCLLCMA